MERSNQNIGGRVAFYGNAELFYTFNHSVLNLVHQTDVGLCDFPIYGFVTLAAHFGIKVIRIQKAKDVFFLSCPGQFAHAPIPTIDGIVPIIFPRCNPITEEDISCGFPHGIGSASTAVNTWRIAAQLPAFIIVIPCIWRFRQFPRINFPQKLPHGAFQLHLIFRGKRNSPCAAAIQNPNQVIQQVLPGQPDLVLLKLIV